MNDLIINLTAITLLIMAMYIMTSVIVSLVINRNTMMGIRSSFITGFLVNLVPFGLFDGYVIWVLIR